MTHIDFQVYTIALSLGYWLVDKLTVNGQKAGVLSKGMKKKT